MRTTPAASTKTLSERAIPRKASVRATAAVLVWALSLAGCGSGGSRANALEQALAAQQNGQDVRCREAGKTSYRGREERVYRCSLVVEARVNAMKAEDGCFVFLDGRAVDVRQLLPPDAECHVSGAQRAPGGAG